MVTHSWHSLHSDIQCPQISVWEVPQQSKWSGSCCFSTLNHEQPWHEHRLYCKLSIQVPKPCWEQRCWARHRQQLGASLSSAVICARRAVACPCMSNMVLNVGPLESRSDLRGTLIYGHENLDGELWRPLLWIIRDSRLNVSSVTMPMAWPPCVQRNTEKLLTSSCIRIGPELTWPSSMPLIPRLCGNRFHEKPQTLKLQVYHAQFFE